MTVTPESLREHAAWCALRGLTVVAGALRSEEHELRAQLARTPDGQSRKVDRLLPGDIASEWLDNNGERWSYDDQTGKWLLEGLPIALEPGSMFGPYQEITR